MINFGTQANGTVTGTFTGTGNIASKGNISIDADTTFDGFTGTFAVADGTTTINAGNLFRAKVIHNAGTINVNTPQKLHHDYTLGSGATLAFKADSATGNTATPVIDADDNIVTLQGGSFIRAKVGGELVRTAEGTQADYLVFGNADSSSTYNAALETTFTEPGVDSNLFTIERVGTTPQQYMVRISRKTAQAAMPRLSPSTAALVNAAVQQYGLDTQSPIPAMRVISRATSISEGIGNDPQLAAATLEGSLQLATVGAVPTMTMNEAHVAATVVNQRTSAVFTQHTRQSAALHMDTDGTVSESGLAAGDGVKNGLGLWLSPLYLNASVWGMRSNYFQSGYSGSFGGIITGADYTIADAFRFGLALHMGAGQTQSIGDFNQTENAFNFWGVSLYGAYMHESLTVAVDAGYTCNYSVVTQHLLAPMYTGALRGDVTSHAWQVGMNTEYKWRTGVADIIPHAGVRYTRLLTDDYDVKNGGILFTMDKYAQDIWSFPVGVTFAKDITMKNGWTFSPQMDAGVIFAAGDVNTRSRAKIPGVTVAAESFLQMADYTTFTGGLGFTLSNNDNVSFALNYNLQASGHRTAHGLNATFQYDF